MGNSELSGFIISTSDWDNNKVWKKANPQGRLVALLHEKSGRIELTRSTAPDEHFTAGVEIPYPARRRQRNIRMPPFIMANGMETDVILNWIK